MNQLGYLKHEGIEDRIHVPSYEFAIKETWILLDEDLRIRKIVHRSIE